MMLVDTHTHLYLDEFAFDRREVVERALQSGVKRMIFPNVDLSTIAPMKELAEIYPENISMAMGLHPTEVTENWKNDLETVKTELDSDPERYIAIGEIGIDLYWDMTYREQQIRAFSTQIDWAIARDLPVIIHCRDGLDDVLMVLASKEIKPKAVFHSFGGSIEDVERIKEIGDFYFGINGIVTFKNSRLSDVLPTIGLDRLLVETDAPYLSPVPYRGKRNESSYIVNTAGKIASVFNMSPDEIAEITTKNAYTLFKKLK